MKNLFENFLKEEFAKNYINIDDDMPDAFEAWLQELDIDELIEYGNDALSLMKIK